MQIYHASFLGCVLSSFLRARRIHQPLHGTLLAGERGQSELHREGYRKASDVTSGASRRLLGGTGRVRARSVLVVVECDLTNESSMFVEHDLYGFSTLSCSFEPNARHVCSLNWTLRRVQGMHFTSFTSLRELYCRCLPTRPVLLFYLDIFKPR